jgi:hypothetical protein
VSKLVLLNTRLFVAGADLTAVTNKVDMQTEVEAKDATTFGSGGAKELLAGLASTSLTAEGFFEAADATKIDDVAFASRGAIGPMTVCPVAATDGALAYFTNGLETDYTLLGGVGDMAPFKLSAQGNWRTVRGTVGHPVSTARTASGNGTAMLLGAVGASQQLYASLHVLAVSGTTPSLTVKVQSDDNVGFTSPTDRLTFTAATAVGGQILRLAGPLTDNYFRVTWTISGTTPSFQFVAAVGIA